MTPYRAPFVVPACPPPLWPYRDGERDVTYPGRWFGTCPKCNRHAKVELMIGRLCTGGSWGFLWLRTCNESREHFHVLCYCCGWRALMAPKFPSVLNSEVSDE